MEACEVAMVLMCEVIWCSTREVVGLSSWSMNRRGLRGRWREGSMTAVRPTRRL